jgi:hypothetical protein
VLFKERLERAHSYAMARAEAALLTLRQRLAGAAAGGGGAAGGAASAGSGSSGGGGAAGAVEAAAATPAAAAAAAAAALPLEQLAGPAWAAMRFNADLQTRAPWLPPADCAAHLAVLRWWEAGAAARAPGAGVWWRHVGAAEAALPAAARARAAQQDGARTRWLLPHLLAAALAAGAPPAPATAAAAGPGPKAAAGSSGGSSGKADAPSASGGGGGGSGDHGAAGRDASLGALLPQFAAALGVAPGGIEAALSEAFVSGGGGSSGGVPASRQLQLLDLALFWTAEAAADLLAGLTGQQQQQQQGSGGSAAGVAGEAAQRAKLLAAALAALGARASAALAPAACACGLAGGDALSLAALLADESCLWVVSCLEVRARRGGVIRQPTRSFGIGTRGGVGRRPLPVGASRLLIRRLPPPRHRLSCAADLGAGGQGGQAQGLEEGQWRRRRRCGGTVGPGRRRGARRARRRRARRRGHGRRARGRRAGAARGARRRRGGGGAGGGRPPGRRSRDGPARRLGAAPQRAAAGQGARRRAARRAAARGGRGGRAAAARGRGRGRVVSCRRRRV